MPLNAHYLYSNLKNKFVVWLIHILLTIQYTCSTSTLEDYRIITLVQLHICNVPCPSTIKCNSHTHGCTENAIVARKRTNYKPPNYILYVWVCAYIIRKRLFQNFGALLIPHEPTCVQLWQNIARAVVSLSHQLLCNQNIVSV